MPMVTGRVEWCSAKLRRVIGRLALITAACVALATAACTPTAAYRTQLSRPDARCTTSATQSCADQVYFQVGASDPTASVEVAQKPVHLGIIEFDDQGYLLKPELKDALIEQIGQVAESTPLLMIVYAHGWKHNGSADDSDVVAFEAALRDISAADAAVCAGFSCARRQVVGIYLAWRGLSATVEPFEELSFWTRKSRAHRVGLDGATEVLGDLAKVRSRSNHSDEAALRDKSRLVLIGHSFGGALLYTATEELMMRDTAFLDRNVVPRTAADLIVLVNPAFEAARFHGLQRRGASIAFAKTQKPILAVFTSKTDSATKTAFPLGRGVGTLFERYSFPGQRAQNVTALGHFEPFRTHELAVDRRLDGTPSAASMPDLRGSLCGWNDFQSGAKDTWDLGALSLSRVERMRIDGQRQNPYLVVSVDGEIIPGHSGIWGDLFSKFLYRFVAVQSARSGGACAAAGADED